MALTSALSTAGIGDCWNRIGVRGDRSCAELERQVHCRNCPVFIDAAAHLLDAPASDADVADRTAHYAQPQCGVQKKEHVFFLFRLGPEWLALPVELLREIAALGVIHSLPHRAGGAVRGVANVRGELLVCVSLHRLLGIEEAVAEKSARRLELRRLLVLKAEGGPIAGPIDEAHGTFSCSAAALRPVPATVARATAACTRAVLEWNDRTVGCLDAATLLARLNRSLA